MPQRETMVLVEHASDQLRCYVYANQRCAANCTGCGHSSTATREIVTLPALASAKPSLAPGDVFELTMRGEILIALSSLVYLLPLLLMLLFAVCSSLVLPGQESLVALAAVLGLGVGMVSVYLFGDRIRLMLQNHLTVR